MTFDYTYSTSEGSTLSLHGEDHDFDHDDGLVGMFFVKLADNTPGT